MGGSWEEFRKRIWVGMGGSRLKRECSRNSKSFEDDFVLDNRCGQLFFVVADKIGGAKKHPAFLSLVVTPPYHLNSTFRRIITLLNARHVNSILYA